MSHKIKMSSSLTPMRDNKNCFIIVNGKLLCQNIANGIQHYINLTPELCRRLNINETSSSLPSTSADQSFQTPELNSPMEPDQPVEQEQMTSLDPIIPAKMKWTVHATQVLINIYSEKKHLFDKCIKHDEIWEGIKRAMDLENFNFSTIQIKNRFVNLKKKFMKVKASEKKTGSAPVHFDYYSEFQDLFGTDHNVEPMAVCRSKAPQKISFRSTEMPNEIQDDNVSIGENPGTSGGVTQRFKINKRKGPQEELKEELKKMRELNYKKWEEKKELKQKEFEEKQKTREMFQKAFEELQKKL